VSVTGTAAATGEAVAWKLAPLVPADTNAVAGTVRLAELLARLIDAPPESVFPDMVTVHVVEPPPITVAGAQLDEEIVTTGGVSVTDATWEEPL
jgi:hypothetical protein